MLWKLQLTDHILYPGQGSRDIYSLYKEKLIDWWIDTVFIGHQERYNTDSICLRGETTNEFIDIPNDTSIDDLKKMLPNSMTDFQIFIQGEINEENNKSGIFAVSSVFFSREKKFLDRDIIDKYDDVVAKYNKLLYAPDGTEATRAKETFDFRCA